MGHGATVNYGRVTKQGFALFAIGAVGELLGHGRFGGIPT
jgi:hypothetical protein